MITQSGERAGLEELPVPRGTMAQGGLEHWESWPTLSRHCRTQLEIIRMSVVGKILLFPPV